MGKLFRIIIHWTAGTNQPNNTDFEHYHYLINGDGILFNGKYMIREVLENQISVAEYRRLTSLIFRDKLKTQGTNTIKANIMAWCVDVFQHYCNKKGWSLGN